MRLEGDTISILILESPHRQTPVCAFPSEAAAEAAKALLLDWKATYPSFDVLGGTHETSRWESAFNSWLERCPIPDASLVFKATPHFTNIRIQKTTLVSCK